MRKLLLVVVALGASLALPGHARAIGQCGLPSSNPLWIDWGTPDVEQVFAHPGLILAVSTGEFPARLRAAGAKTIYWDMNLNRRVGTPTAPADPATIVDRANRLFDFAATQSGCDKPLIVLNELFGSHLETPWTPTNTQYRTNVLTFLRTLSERGARPFLLLSTIPFTSGDAADWWREAAKYADLVPEVYFGAPSVWKQGPIVGNRRLRVSMRRAVAELLAIGIPPAKLGIVLGFQTTRGGREGLSPASAWFEVVKWQALAARQVQRELGFGTILSWGWSAYTAAARDPDKPAAACVYLWARNPSLCDGPTAAGPDFDQSRTEGQLILPSGAQCTVGDRRLGSSVVAALHRVTADREVALAVLLARLAEAGYVKVSPVQVLAAERAVISLRFAGSRSAYNAALARANASVAIARAALADELRRMRLETTMRARLPSSREVGTFYASYPELLTRVVEIRPGPWWLGGRKQGLALASLAPQRLFSVAAEREVKVRALEGLYTVRALGEAQPLGSVPLAQARPAISAALAAFGRRAAFEEWTIARQTSALQRTVCRKDALPTPGAVRLTSFLPFLSLTES